MGRRGVAGGLLSLALSLGATGARGADPPPAARDPYDAFPLLVPHDKHYVRAGLEVGAVLAVGIVDYMLSTTARGGTTRPGDERWGFRYDWPTLRGKLIGTGLDLDTNRITTNYVSHPLAGTLYYTAARSNHLSLAESYGIAVLGSTTWELFGEIRETTSINDLVVTPVSGVAIGEPLMQLSGFFQRGKRRLATDVVSFLLSPVKVINELADGAVPLPARTDALGLPVDPWHRFVLAAGLGVTVQEADRLRHPQAAYLDQRFSADLRLVNLPSYASAGHQSRLFDEGNVSRVSVEVGMSRGHLVEGRFATSLVPAGYFYRDATLDAAGNVRGSGVFMGLRMGFEYGGHDYDRDRARPVDTIALASPVGLSAEHLWSGGGVEVRTALEVSGAIAAVTPYAFARYRETYAVGDVLTPVREQGYYHAFAVTAAPSLEVAFGGLRWSSRLRVDGFRAIEGRDAQEQLVKDGPRFGDRRSLLETSLAFVAPRTPWRLALDVRRATRAGSVGSVTESRDESSASASMGAEF